MGFSALALTACGAPHRTPDQALLGDADQGAIEIGRSACGSCHHIPGIQFAEGRAGPPLDHLADRAVIAGVAPNTPASLVRWLRHPQQVLPGAAMPDEGLDLRQARDIAAYLYTLR